MFTDTSEEQHLYHSVATVGTLLLQIGEVGKRFRLSSSTSAADDTAGGDGNLKAETSAETTVKTTGKDAEDTSAEGNDSKVTSSDSKVDSSSPDCDRTATVSCESGSPLTPQDSTPVHREPSNNSSSSEDATPTQVPASSPKNTSEPDKDWSVSFEQLLASMLTEAPLVEFFERIYDTSDAVAALRNRRLVTRMTSMSASPAKDKL